MSEIMLIGGSQVLQCVPNPLQVEIQGLSGKVRAYVSVLNSCVLVEAVEQGLSTFSHYDAAIATVKEPTVELNAFETAAREGQKRHHGYQYFIKTRLYPECSFDKLISGVHEVASVLTFQV